MGKRNLSVLALVILAPAFLLIAVGYTYFCDGRTADAAFPVPSDLALNVRLPRAAYVDAAQALGGSDRRNGENQLALLQSRFYAGEKPVELVSATANTLAQAPASAQAWIFYAELLSSKSRQDAVLALDQAFILSPYDYFWAGARTQLAAQLYSSLDPDTMERALRQTRMLWSEPALHDDLYMVLQNPGSAALVTRAFQDDPETIRAINRWVSAKRRQAQHA